jgi:hypothetical protein
MKKEIAVCGIGCELCDIRRAPEDPAAAQRIVAWYKKEGWLKDNEGIKEVVERSMYCNGCKSDRSVHWSPDCEILQCCVDTKGHQFCSACSDFVCERLEKWAHQNEHYREALNRLKIMDR